MLAPRPPLLGLRGQLPVLVGLGNQGWDGAGSPVIPQVDERRACVGAHGSLSGLRVLSLDAHTDFHRAPERRVETCGQAHDVADFDRRLELDRLDARGDRNVAAVPLCRNRAADVDPAHDDPSERGADGVGVLGKNELGHLGKRLRGGPGFHGWRIGYNPSVQRLFTRQESREVDRVAIEELGVVSLVLMENAGRGATDALCDVFDDRLDRVVLVGGPGQNGGDAWVVARRLLLLGHRPLAVLVGESARLRGDAQANWALLGKLGVETIELPPDQASTLGTHLRDASLVVDGLFGTGLDRPITGGYADAVTEIEAAAAPVVALDLPSGLDADTGAVFGVAPGAALTVTFAGHKRGLHQYPGVEHAGEVRVVDIGVPVAGTPSASLWMQEDLAALIAPRADDAHKGTHGHLLVIGGAPGKTGAAVLAGRAAFRAGAGLVTIGARADSRAALEEKVIELMTTELPGEASPAAVEEICREKRAAVLGPGMGLDDLGRAWALAVARHAPVPTVIDADGLTHLVDEGLEVLRNAAAPRVLTPHPGEAARLLGVSTSEVQRDRYTAAAALAERSGQVVILKGARSIVAALGELRVCAEGTPALGVAGTGDVLSGVVGALCMSLAPVDAAIGGALLHALAGVEASVGDRGLIASEVADAVPVVLEHLG